MSEDLTQRVIEIERRLNTLEDENRRPLMGIFSVNAHDYFDGFAKFVSKEIERMTKIRGLA